MAAEAENRKMDESSWISMDNKARSPGPSEQESAGLFSGKIKLEKTFNSYAPSPALGGVKY